MLKDILTCLRSIIAGYFLSVLGIILVSIALSFTPLKGEPWVYIVASALFILLGGSIASTVSRNYRIINSAFVGFIHIFWALYRGGYAELNDILAIPVLAIPLAVVGGMISKKLKPTVREIEQI